MSNDFDLHDSRLGTSDEKGRRVFLYPREVWGRFQKLKLKVHAVLVIFFLVAPWIQVGGKQSIQLDIVHRRFTFFGATFWSHDAPLLVFLFLGFAFLIAFITSIWGRVWCGWACPQTVFIDGVYRRIERWTEGDAFTRRKRDQEPMTLDWAFKKSIKWFLFLAVTLVITHSFLAYFVGANEVLNQVRRPPSENWGSFLVILSTTGILLFDFVWFREQFCVIMCPYGRLQSALFDDQTQVIAYDEKRGEPRKGTLTAEMKPALPQGDCVNCYRCVQVCPTGIDIRRGTQLECVACAACIDACDEVMVKTKRPLGLIRYDSYAGITGGSLRRSRLRYAIYALSLLAIAGGFYWKLNQRTSVQVVVLRAVDRPFQLVPGVDGTEMVLNHFKLELNNQTESEVSIQIAPSAANVAQGVELVSQKSEVVLAGDSRAREDIFIRIPRRLMVDSSIPGKLQLKLEWKAQGPGLQSPIEKVEEVTFVGPFK